MSLASQPRRLLLVDDDEVDRLSFRRTLRRLDTPIEVVEASTIDESLPHIDGGLLDWIVVDYNLPDGEGTQVVRHAQSVTPYTPAIVLTGSGDESLVVKLLRAGARDYIPKAELTPARLGQSLRITAELADAARAASAAQQAQRFLAGPGADMLGHIDHDGVLRSTVDSCVGPYSDVCLIDLFEEDGLLRRAAAGYVSGELGEALEATYGSGERRFTRESQLARILDGGEVARLSAGDGTWIDELGLRDGKAFSPAGATLVPLRARGRTIGLLTMLSGEGSGAGVDPEVAQIYGSRVALALDNARLYDEVKRAVRVREEVLAVVAHDLRNLLHTMKAGVHLLLELDLPREKQTRHLRSVARASDRMNDLIADLLDISRLEAGMLSIERQPVSPRALISEAAEGMGPLADASDVTFEVEVDAATPEVLGDDERLLRVLFNLITNAIRYTQPGGCVRLHAGPHGDGVRIGVTDSGPGIPDDELRNLFTPFWQSDRRSAGSTGLGLAIADAIVDLHGGEIRVDTHLGRGTTFWIDLPGTR